MDRKWSVVYYMTERGDIPVRDFLDAAGPALKVKALRILGAGSARILFVTQVGKRILLLHAFYKKTQKTPQKEIALALKRLHE